ncbi:MAG: diguanylate cyclase [Spirochaetales bacterium]|nr:diguanylate cyclase [Spirochaetales bacterium]
MSDILREENKYILLQASSGEEALEILQKEEVHIVLLDVLMPGMDGYEVCRQIRKAHKMKPIQIVMISGFDQRSDLDELLEYGADDFISKPIAALELHARIRAAVIRWRNQVRLIEDLRGEAEAPEAGDSKERLSSLAVENVQLRREYQKVRLANEELQRNCDELERLASYDPLSGLLNRRTLFRRIDVEIERATRMGFPLTGLMIDIDHFKPVNDNYGHQCGDTVIREIGAKLSKSLRKYDYAGRYGGEEFFVLFPNTSSETARIIAERFRKDMEESPFSCGNGPLRITVSVGVAQHNPNETPDKWISRADTAMYRAKQRGRNQVVVG